MTPLQNALVFTVSSFFNLYIIIVLIRFLLQFAYLTRYSAAQYGPIAQVARQFTNPVLGPLNKIIPSFRNINFAAILLAIILQALESWLILQLKGFGIPANPMALGGLFLWSSGEVLDLLLLMLFIAIIIQAIISWIMPYQSNPTLTLLEKITDPVLLPVRRVVPSFGMLDFSPLIALFLLSLLRMLVAAPLAMFGRSLI